MSALQDTGFADRGVIAPLVRRIALRGAISDSRIAIEALLDLLNEQREPLGGDLAAAADQGIGLTGCDGQRGVADTPVGLPDRDRVREDELLQAVEMVPQLLERLDVGIRHGLFSAGDAGERIPAEGDAHRLSGGAK